MAIPNFSLETWYKHKINVKLRTLSPYGIYKHKHTIPVTDSLEASSPNIVSDFSVDFSVSS